MIIRAWVAWWTHRREWREARARTRWWWMKENRKQRVFWWLDESEQSNKEA